MEELLNRKYKNHTVKLREDGIIEIEVFNEPEVTVQDIIEGTDYIMEIVAEKKFPVLFIAQKYSIPTKETREYMAKKKSLPYSLADAFVLTSLPQKLLGNFYLKVNKPHRPTKMFTNQKEAVNWLKTFL
jgi:hypothetical protein